MENIYHVITSANVADIPTRPDKCSLQDVGPGSEWEWGRPWMTKEISQLVNEGTLTPIADLASLQDDDQEDFKEGFVMSHIPDMINRRHTTLLARDDPNRCPRILARAEHSQYLVFPEITKLYI